MTFNEAIREFDKINSNKSKIVQFLPEHLTFNKEINIKKVAGGGSVMNNTINGNFYMGL